MQWYCLVGTHLVVVEYSMCSEWWAFKKPSSTAPFVLCLWKPFTKICSSRTFMECLRGGGHKPIWSISKYFHDLFALICKFSLKAWKNFSCRWKEIFAITTSGRVCTKITYSNIEYFNFVCAISISLIWIGRYHTK